MDIIEKKLFKDIELEDKFFDSLKADYPGFDEWFIKKKSKGKSAYVFVNNGIQGFLYLKEENEEAEGVNPSLKAERRLKVGTFKINAHGTKLGERFIKIIIDEIFKEDYKEAYVTIFKRHSSLIELLEKYGFAYYGTKESKAGIENVYLKSAETYENDILLDYPRISLSNVNKFMLSIWPKYHTMMFPDSKLNTEKNHIIEDLSITNSIEKIYLSGADLSGYSKGDIVVIYRTADAGRGATYSSVATSICIVEEVKSIYDFRDYNEFENYCIKHSVFNKSELDSFWRSKKYESLIKMLYNVAIPKRVIRQKLIEQVRLNASDRWVSVSLTDEQFEKIIELGDVNESLIIN